MHKHTIPYRTRVAADNVHMRLRRLDPTNPTDIGYGRLLVKLLEGAYRIEKQYRETHHRSYDGL